MTIKTDTTITIPKDLLGQLFERSESLLEAHEQLEDFFMMQNPSLIVKLREARDQHIKGDLISYGDLKARYGI